MQTSEKLSVLQGVNDWVKYSDAKAAIILGFQGAVVGFFFVQRNDFSYLVARYGWFTQIFFGLGLLGLVISIVLVALAIYPRLNVGGSSSNIYFAHIGQLPTAADYRNRLAKPAHSFEEDVENQIWANSVVAWRKYKLVSRSIGIGISAYVCLGLAAFSGWLAIHS